jgi:hypothetical protein
VQPEPVKPLILKSATIAAPYNNTCANAGGTHQHAVLVHIIFLCDRTAAGASGSLTNAVGSETSLDETKAKAFGGFQPTSSLFFVTGRGLSVVKRWLSKSHLLTEEPEFSISISGIGITHPKYRSSVAMKYRRNLI